jgi:hypothetical protein
MTHKQIVAALQRDYQLDDARESRRDCYPIRKPTRRTTVRRMWTTRCPPTSRTPPGSAKAASSDAMTLRPGPGGSPGRPARWTAPGANGSRAC